MSRDIRLSREEAKRYILCGRYEKAGLGLYGEVKVCCPVKYFTKAFIG